MGRSNPSQHVKDLVDARDQYRCVRCGKPFHWSGFSRHHRRLRSHKWPGLHEASNLILACGSGDTGMKPRVYDDLVQSAVELSCFGTGQSTIEEGRAAYQAWLKEHDRQIAEKAWEEGYIQAVKNMNPMPGEESPEYTLNPYRKENA